MRCGHARIGRLVALFLLAMVATALLAAADRPRGERFVAGPLKGGDRAEGGVASTCGGEEFTQSFAPDLIQGEASLACGSQVTTLATSLARSFPSPPEIAVGCVTFGVDVNTGGPWPVEVRLLTGTINGPYAALTLLAETTVTIPAGSAGSFHTALFPSAVTAPPGQPLIVELRVPSRHPADGGDGAALFLGCNGAGQSAPTYIRAPGCGVQNFVNAAAIGFGGSHLAMTVATAAVELDCPWGDAACCAAICAVDPSCCGEGPWDIVCAVLASQLCGGGSGPCGLRDAGSCFEPSAAPGCADALCCESVCAALPECCSDGWDEFCVIAAFQLCDPPVASGCIHDDPTCAELVCRRLPDCCDVAWDETCLALEAVLCACPDGCGIPEEELCGEDENDGCGPPSDRFRDLECNVVICGRLWAQGGMRDRDSFRFIHCGGTLSARLWWNFPGRVTISDDACPPNVLLTVAGGVPVTASLALPAGRYVVTVTPFFDTGPSCDDPENLPYRLLLLGNCCDREYDPDEFAGCLDPDDPQIEPPQYTLDLGALDQLSPGVDVSTAAWYADQKCPPSVGGELPKDLRCIDTIKAQIGDDLCAALQAAGYLGACPTPEEIVESLAVWNDAIGAIEETVDDGIEALGPVAPSYAPSPPWTPGEGCFAFGGRDIVFVHGLRTSPILQKVFTQETGPETEWPADEAQFFDGGYWKNGAEAYWEEHIERFLRAKGYRNRYLVVSYASTQRLGVGAHAVLTQIAKAMNEGVGVRNCANDGTHAFGANGFVVISHSQGALMTGVAMGAAATKPSLQAGFIADRCKAHIAFNGAVTGSQYATAVLAATGYLAYHANPSPVPGWACPLANIVLEAMNRTGAGTNPLLDCTPDFSAFFSSNLVDLVPAVSRFYWGQKYVRHSPTRTLTVDGADATFLLPFKYILNPGFDDGVVTTSSQVGSPNPSLFWPARFVPGGLPVVRWVRLSDPTLPLVRRASYFIEQTVQFPGLSTGIPLFPIYAASGATPYLTPWGMRTHVGVAGFGGPFDARNRYENGGFPNHASFISSGSDHFESSTEVASGNSGEDVLVMTGPWSFYYGGYGLDNVPLFSSAFPPSQWVRVTESAAPKPRTIKLGLVTVTLQRFRWKRTHDRLLGWESKLAPDYVYELVLCPDPNGCHGCFPCPPELVVGDLNGDDLVNAADLAALLGDWGQIGSPADLDGDGVVGAGDLATLLGAWTGG